MKPQLTILALSLALAGCNSSSDSDTSTPTYSVSGTIAAQNIALDSKVCADLNQNFTCDSNEPVVQANKNGEFTIIHTSKDILNRPLLASLDSGQKLLTDSDSEQKYYLIAPGLQKPSGNIINGVSSLVAGLMAGGMTDKGALAYLEQQFSTLGVDINGSLIDHLDDASLATLDQNIVSLMKQVNDEKRMHVTTLMSSHLQHGASNLLSVLLIDAESAALVLTLEKIMANNVGLNDTGVTLYYTDVDENKGSTSPQKDYPGQDADFGFDSVDKDSNSGKGFKFVKLDANGIELSDDADEWNCIADKRSGLVWESKTNASDSIQYKDRMLALEIPGKVMPYKEDLALATCVDSKDSICSTQDYVEHINEIKLCGKSDWRLPTGYEFYNLIDFGETKVDGDGDVYGLTVKYFPNQSVGSEYLEFGNVWTQAVSYTIYTPNNIKGAVSYSLIGTNGAERGEQSPYEIYTDKVSDDNNDSYTFPTRLVSTGGK
ncbi:MAG: hypothetical protein ACI935_002418 [Moritella dasanensis]|jgi:hypothetical protein